MHNVRWRLTPLQLDHVWESLAVDELPYPFQIRCHGQDDAERAHLRRQTALELRSMGLLQRDDELEVDLRAALTALARNDHSLDSVWLPLGQGAVSPVRVMAARTGPRAT